ncbi:topology modulation protein [Lysinibacillus sp. NPDC096418]|uniref:topology modulation protein n=1 Tax=Lysinibacillus sp. NPDC096418 TaxID=3364138 RepID=UPI003823B8E8
MRECTLIVGSSGAGKSTLARQLGAATSLPIIHLDSLYWQPGWIGTEKVLFNEKLIVELQKFAWIIDGNFDSTLELRAQYADLIIMLDYDKKLCLYRAMKRYITHLGKTRADMTPGCPKRWM